MFSLGNSSLTKLGFAHPDLIRVIKRAIQITAVDFSVGETIRSVERQKQLVAAGASKTMNSRHLPGSLKLSNAADLHAYVAGQLSWDWPLYFKIADAMRQAARDCSVQIEWGGVWDRRLNDLQGNLENECHQYVSRRKAMYPDRDVFIDGPHFQLPASIYP